MSLTTQQRLNKLTIYANQYVPLEKLPPQLLVKFIEHSRDHVWRGIIIARDYLFRKTATVADGDAYPADFVSYANNAYYTYLAVVYPFAYLNTQEIGSATNNTFALGSNTTPKLYFTDHTIKTIPAGLSGITFEYIFQPTALSTTDLSVTDEMPEDTEDMIVRGAFERVLGQLRNDRDMLELAGLQKEDVQAAAVKYYQDYYQKNVIAGGEIEIIGENSK